MIAVENLSVHAGDFRLSGISLSIPAARYGVLMGKTGSGKTTLLETILGLRPIDGGRILIGGDDVTRLDPAVRGIGYVPQDGALFNHMTVRDHLGFALFIRQIKESDIERRVQELARLLGIESLLDRKPKGLSGGERQRVALGRALSFRPRVLCLDEPLSALDSETRRQMCRLLKDIQHKTGVTTLHVTHNLDETETLADVLLKLEDSQVTTSAVVRSDPVTSDSASQPTHSQQPTTD